jgi:hypothetical protein
MITYKVFIVENEGDNSGKLRAIFSFFYYHKGENTYEKNTLGIGSWKKKSQAQRFKQMLTAQKMFYKVVIKEIEVKDKDIIKTEKIKMYTKEAIKKFKIKKNSEKIYAEAVYSKKIHISVN